MTQRTHMYAIPVLFILLMLAQPVMASGSILAVGKMSSIPYDIYLCQEKVPVDDIIEIQRAVGLNVARIAIDQYAELGMCDTRIEVYIQVNDVYYMALLDFDGEKHPIAVVSVTTSDGEILYGAIPAEDLGLRPT